MGDTKKRRPVTNQANIKRPKPSVNLVEQGRNTPAPSGPPVRKGRTTAPGTIARNPTLYDGRQYSFGPPPGPDDGRHYAYGSPGANRLYESEIIANAARNRATSPVGPSEDPSDPFSGPSGPGNGNGIDIGEGTVEEPPAPVGNPEQEAFIARLMAMRDETLAGYGPSSDKIKGYYDTASADLADPYNDYMNQYRTGATSLGLNFDADPNVKLADVAGRKLQETYDLNETTDLSTVEKMKSLQGDSFTQMLLAADAGLLGPIVAQNELALANAGAASSGGSGGGGGGGGGGSGGSSSNPFSEKATQDEAFYNPGMVDAISGISDPELRDYTDLIYAGTGTNPRSALNRAVQDYEKFAAYKPPAPTARRGSNVLTNAAYSTQKLIGKAQAKKKADDLKVAQAAINFFKNWSPGYKPQTTKQSVQTTSTTKNK